MVGKLFPFSHGSMSWIYVMDVMSELKAGVCHKSCFSRPKSQRPLCSLLSRKPFHPVLPSLGTAPEVMGPAFELEQCGRPALRMVQAPFPHHHMAPSLLIHGFGGNHQG